MIPKDFAEYTRRLMGDELYSILENGLSQDAPVSVRLNPFKTHDGLDGCERVPWCEWGYWLPDRPAFTFDPLLHAGLYYVQEASSMFVTEAVRQCIERGVIPQEPLLAADICAAPGGKSTALRSILPEGSLLFSNEPMKQRASVLKENIVKFGHPDVIVTNNFPRDYKKTGLLFDLVVADVPCSGEGLFMAVLRKNGANKKERAITTENKGKANKKKASELDKWLIGDFSVVEANDGFRAIPSRWLAIYNNVVKKLHVIHAGVELGVKKGKDIIPDTSLALSTALNKSAFPQAELDTAQAVNYLRKEAVTLPTGAPRGFTLVTYRQQPLGFVKNIGQRANNIYPQEWKIKSSHIPSSASSLPWHATGR